MTINDLIKFLKTNFEGSEQVVYTLYTSHDVKELCRNIYEELVLTEDLINELFESVDVVSFESLCEYIEENFLG